MRRLGTRRLRWAASGVMVAGLAVGAAGYAASAGAEAATTGSQAATGVLNLNATLALHSFHGGLGCDPGPTGDCAGRTISGAFPGLGQVSGKYSLPIASGPPWCALIQTKFLGYTARLSVAGKGEIHVAVADGAECLDWPAIRTQGQTFTVTGGAGTYLGATGSGTLTRTLPLGVESHGTETWTGTLNVSGYEFNTTRPTISGATSKTVRAKKGAKSARVTFMVTAQDDTDGVVPTQCDPKSGSRFQLGRTQVICAATDSNGNTATAAFRITVRATR
jgi:hypothetical protein